MIVVAIIGLLAAIAIPNFVRARQTAQNNACMNNLRVIDGAENQYALESGLKTGATAPTTTQLLVYVGHNTTTFRTARWVVLVTPSVPSAQLLSALMLMGRTMSRNFKRPVQLKV